MMRKMLTALVLSLLATAILLPNSACRGKKEVSVYGISDLENIGSLDVLL